MKRLSNSWAGGLLAVLLAAAFVAGCSKSLERIFIQNQLPTVQITSAPIDTNAVCNPDPVRSCYAVTINWTGNDPDGRIERYLYAVDPSSARDTVWQITRENEVRVILSSRSEIPSSNPNLIRRLAEEPHVFVLKAIDNKGEAGPLTSRAFFSFTEAPTVQILNPVPKALLVPVVPPSVRVQWTGRDPDGVFTNKPVKYKYILLNQSSLFPVEVAAQRPDSLKRFYAPTFAGWDSTSADSTDLQFTNLTPGQVYMFVVVGFDEAGAYSPIFSLNSNMLRFKVGFAGVQGPKISFFNDFFNYTYSTGGYCPCTEIEVFVELAARTAVTMNWSAEPPVGATIRSYRWAVDIQDVTDQTPRTDETLDTAHWSTPSASVTSVRLGPYFVNGEEHRLYVEAEDNVGLKSLGIVRFLVVSPTFESELLVVDDTRMTPDIFRGPCANPPLGDWPTAAELDTFLYAVGGTPWQCYPAGTTTPPGLFNGYRFDTLGTRRGSNDPTVRLGTLGKWRHVIWLTDFLGSDFAGSGADAVKPINALKYMTGANRVNTLAAYVTQGGKVWAAGGGIAKATTLSGWDDRVNNSPPGRLVFNFAIVRELGPGRFMYDLPHWRSAIGVQNEAVTVVSHVGRFRVAAGSDPRRIADRARSPWSSYTGLIPAVLERKGVAPADPIAPNRTNQSSFFLNSIPVEYLFIENRIIETIVPDSTFPDQTTDISTLDTLFSATGPGMPTDVNPDFRNVVMTYYHGPNIPQGFIHSGFSLWNFKRAHCKALVDFVLKYMWNMTPNVQSRPVRQEVSATRSAAPTLRRGPGAGRLEPVLGQRRRGTTPSHPVRPRP